MQQVRPDLRRVSGQGCKHPALACCPLHDTTSQIQCADLKCMHWHLFYAFGLAKGALSPWSTEQLDMNLGMTVTIGTGGQTAC